MSDAEERGFRLQGVCVTANGAAILQQVDLALPAAAWSAVLGPSGSGKTSLLRVLNRLSEPSAGSVRFAGRALGDYDVRALRRTVALVVQQPRLGGGSVRACLELPVRLGALDAATGGSRLPWACAIAQLPGALLDRDLASLSGGERQRVALARALMLEPSALLLDEPTAALDRDTARQLLSALEGLRRERALTLVTVTHRVEELAAFGPYCARLAASRVIEHGPLSALHGAESDARTD